MKTFTREDFDNKPVMKLIVGNSVPALIAMIMIMVYNLADIFFIGLTHNDLQIAAVSIATPVFMIFMSLGTMFGVGGTSLISRALGGGDQERAKKVCSFCMWSCIVIGVVFTLILFLKLEGIMKMLGVSVQTHEYAKSYLEISLFCGVFSMISACFSSILRTEGEPMKAMTGTVIGNVLNIILDPIMILACGWGITGAAIATVIGNVVSAVYYLLHFLTKKSSLSISPKYFSCKDGIAGGVLAVGVSAAMANLLSSVSAILVNSRLSAYGDLSVAAYGVTSKVLMVITLLGIGIGSGVQPLIGYYYGSGNDGRLKECIRKSSGFATAVCFAAALICFILARPIACIFLTDSAAIEDAVVFIRILMLTAWLIGAFGIYQNSLQAMGAAVRALLASIIRQIVIFVPAVFLLESLLGKNGLLWAQPVSDVLSLAVVYLFLRGFLLQGDGYGVKAEKD